MKNFIQSGRTLTVSAPADIKSGDLVVVGSLFGVAYCDAAIGADVEIGPFCHVGSRAQLDDGVRLLSHVL